MSDGAHGSPEAGDDRGGSETVVSNSSTDNPTGASLPEPTIEVVDGELVEEVRALRAEIRATIDYNVSGQSGLTPSQIEAIDLAKPDLRALILHNYEATTAAEIDATRQMTALTVKDQGDGVALARLGMKVLVGVVAALVGIAALAILMDQPGVAVAALGPIGVVAIGGVIRMALRNRHPAEP